VIALTDGALWYLERKVFKRLVMRSIDNFKLMQRLLRKVQLFSCFSMEQIRKIVKLLSEEKFLAGEEITGEGLRNEKFYIIIKGECECSVKEVDIDGEGEGKGLVDCSHSYILKKDDHFGEHSLLSVDTLSDRTIIAKTDVKVMCVSKHDFEEALGPLSEKVESYKAVRDADVLSRIHAPTSMDDVAIHGFISTDNIGCILLGSFGTLPIEVTVRTFLLSDVDRLKAIPTILNSMEAFRVINASSQKNGFVFRLLSVCHEPNALHLIINVPVVADLESLLVASSAENTIRTTEETVIYVATCTFCALEFLHSLGIIYRSVQPEAIYVDSRGRVLLGSFRVSKVGTVGGRTYTIAGTTDYLAPEQVGRQGHSAPVDLWALGVVLYELATGVHPFTAEGDTEFMTYSKISSYGTRAFPKLFFPDGISRELVSLIERLLVPVPDLRLGAGLRGYDAVKEIFNNLDWERIRSYPPPSPLAASAAAVREEMITIGVEPSIIASFKEPFTGDPWYKSVVL
jgi:serine/threonine protein kinase